MRSAVTLKTSTKVNKLNAILGISEKVAEIATKNTGKIVGVTEEEIQEFREIQAIDYFLQAPSLFSPKTCKHCGEHFLVSRKYVAYCSYTCIRESMKEKGLKWKKGEDLEALALDPQVYQGNEPLWIRQRCLQKIQEALNEELLVLGPTVSPYTSPTPTQSKPEPTSGGQPSAMETLHALFSSSLPTPTSLTEEHTMSEPSIKSSKRRGKKRRLS